LIGHAREMALGSDVTLRITASQVPLLAGAVDCVRLGAVPGGLKTNREFAECVVEYQNDVPEEIKTLLFDPQTAGGLLISTPDAEAVLAALKGAAVRIGEVTATGEKPIVVSAAG
jgi:selenide,water dikinase